MNGTTGLFDDIIESKPASTGLFDDIISESPKKEEEIEVVAGPPRTKGKVFKTPEELEASFAEPMPEWKSALRGLTHPSGAIAITGALSKMSPEEKKSFLLDQYNRAIREGKPTTLGKGLEIGASIPGGAVPFILGGMRGRPGMAAVGAAMGYSDAFTQAGIKALMEDKDLDEALEIAEAAAKVGAATGAGSAAVLPTKVEPTLKGAVKTGAIGGPAFGASQYLQNLAQKYLGLKTPPLEGVLEATIFGGLVPVVAKGAERVLRIGRPVPTPEELRAPPVLEVPSEPVPVKPTIVYPGVPPVAPMEVAPSGLSMRVRPNIPEAGRGIPATEAMLELLPEPTVETVAISDLLRTPVERGPALAAVEELGQSVRRSQDFEKARMEQFSQTVEEYKNRMFHPDKPLTQNQLRIVQDSLKKAILENQIPGERKGIISGSKLEQWADSVLDPSTYTERWGKKSSVNPVQYFTEPIPALIVKGLAVMERGVMNFADWSKEMISQHGKEIEPFLKKVYIQTLHLHSQKPTEQTAKPVTTRTAFSERLEQAGERGVKPESARLAEEYEGRIGDLEKMLSEAETESKKIAVESKSKADAAKAAGKPIEEVLAINNPPERRAASSKVDILKEAVRVSKSVQEKAPKVETVPEKLRMAEAKKAEEPIPKPTEPAPLPAPEIEQPLGAVAPGTQAAQAVIAAAGRSAQRLNRTRQAFGAMFRSSPSRKIMEQTWDAIDTEANIVGQQAGKHIKLGATPAQDRAASAIVAAGFDPNKLPDLMTKAVRGGNQEAIDAVSLAMRDWNTIEPIARRGKQVFDQEISAENQGGINTEYHEDYLPGIYDMDLMMGAGRPFVISGHGGGRPSTAFKKGKTYDTPFDAIADGYVPKSLKLSDLAEHRVKVGQKLLNKKEWAQSLRSVTDPTDNLPIVTSLQRRQRGTGGTWFEVAPAGYEPREIIPGVRIAIHEGYRSLFDALTGNSRISGSAPGRILLETAGGIKHGLLAFDTFHASRIMQKELFLTGKISYKKGQTLLEYADRDLARAVREGEITQEIADWVRTNRTTADLLIKNGLNVGRIQEALYNSLIRDLPIIGKFNKWVFEKLTRGAMLESGLIEFERVSRARPDLTPDRVAQQVARDLNAYFGNLGSQGIFKSRQMQDIARLVALAPNWVESMARTEVLGSAQALKGLTYDPLVHRTILTGSIGKGVAQGLLAYFVGTQLLNLFTRKQFTWQNEESGHKLDAWIPDTTGKSHGFFISPFSVVAELTHDMIRYSKTEDSAWKAAIRIASNKSSPLWRAGKVLLTGKDWNKTQINDFWDRVKASAWALAPTPIPLSPIVKGTEYPGQVQRQLTASAGFKTEPAPGPAQQISERAREFRKSVKGEPTVEITPTQEAPYNNLRRALRIQNLDQARKAYTELRKTKSRAQIIKTLRPYSIDTEGIRHFYAFTGSSKLEPKFKATLTPQELKLYDEAKKERMNEWKLMQNILRTQPN